MVVKSRALSSAAKLCTPVVAMETACGATASPLLESGDDVDMCSDAEEESGASDECCDDDSGEDESDSDEVVEPEDAADGSVSGSRGKKGASMRPPTADEMVSLRETQNLFHSNLFRLQTTEMLREITPSGARQDQLRSWLKELGSWLLALPARRRPCTLTDLRWLATGGVQVPLLLDRLPEEPWHQLLMVCGAPARVEPAGALLLGTMCRGACVDVLVEMPTAALESKDVINARYLRKRAVYVGYLAWRLQSCPLVSNVRFSRVDDDPLRPVVLLDPLLPGSSGAPRSHGYTVRLLVVPSSGADGDSPLFPVERLSICRSNVQSRWLSADGRGSGEMLAPQLEPATPHYNSLLLADQLSRQLQRWRAARLGGQADGSWRQALRLLAVWLQQRQLLRDGLGGMLMSMFLLYLADRRRVSPMMSAYQVMRTMWAQLSTTDWSVEGITFVETPSDRQPPLGEFHQHYDVVFVDPSGHHNLASAVSLHVYQRLRDESARALAFLDDPRVDSFQAVFMHPLPWAETFDHVAVLPLDPSSDAACRRRPAGLSLPALCRDLLATLRRGLSDRVTLLDARTRDAGPHAWPVSETPPLRPVTVCVGLRVAPERVGSTVDRGPEPGAGGSLEEAEFRQLWGSRVQTRRFQDGQIQLAVVWPAPTTAEKRMIPRQIVLHLLHLHHQIDPASVGFNSDGVECLLADTRLLPPVSSSGGAGGGYGCGEQSQLEFISVQQQLSSRLRQLRLPLVVTGVTGVSAAHRYAAPFPPLPEAQHALVARSTRHGSSQLLERQSELEVPHCSPLDVLVHLEISGKWPTDPEAIRRVITAFHLQMCEELRHLGYTVSCRRDSVLLLFEGYMFRLRVANPRGRGHQRRQDQENQEQRPADGDVCDDHQMAALSSALAGLQGQHPAYSTACRLAVRWVNSHMMSDLFPDIVAELIMADVFLCPAPHPPAQQPCAALLRWWRRLATCDWKNRPLVVDIDGTLASGGNTDAAAAFSAAPRHTLPPLVIYTASDRSGTALTAHSPTAAVLVHAQKLAWQSLQQVSAGLLLAPDPAGPALDWRVAFRPALAGMFHLTVRLCRRQCLLRHQAVDPAGPVRHLDAYERRQYEALAPAGRAPVPWLVRRLRAAFGPVALFWHDRMGGPVIGVLLRPGCLAPRPFSVAHVAGCGPEGGAGQMAFSVQAMAEYIRVLGAGIVESVEVNADKLAEVEAPSQD